MAVQRDKAFVVEENMNLSFYPIHYFAVEEDNRGIWLNSKAERSMLSKKSLNNETTLSCMKMQTVSLEEADQNSRLNADLDQTSVSKRGGQVVLSSELWLCSLSVWMQPNQKSGS